MVASDHLNSAQFRTVPMEDIGRMRSHEFGIPMHEVPALFESVNEDVSELAADVAENGIQRPMVVRGNEFVEGHHRFAAATKAGLTHAPLAEERDVYPQFYKGR